MRVIHVAPTPFGRDGLLGGGERYPLELARALAKYVSCELVTFGRAPNLVHEAGGLRVRTLRALGYLQRHPAHALAPALVGALRGADVVHTHHLRSMPSRVAGLAARARGQAIVTTDHGLQGGNWAGLLPRLFQRFLCVSRYSAVELGLPPARTRIIYGGADPARYFPDPALTRKGVLFVGRLTPHKGVDRLIAALPPGAHLLVAGSTGHDPGWPERGYPAYLRRLANNRNVTFLGAVPDSKLALLYRQAAVLVLPSVTRTCYGREVGVSELLGLTVLEAMASGTPVVASRLGGLTEIVHHGETGLLVQPGDVADLCDALNALLVDPGLRARLGQQGRDQVLAQFTWDAVAQRCLTAYTELLQRPQWHGGVTHVVS